MIGMGKHGAHRGHGFTRLELIAILAVAFAGLVLARPALGYSAQRSKGVICLSNFRRLSRAWLEFAHDNGGSVPQNIQGGLAINPTPPNVGWVSGWLDWTTSPANTNALLLIDGRYAQLAPYVGGDAALFKCPSDIYLSAAQAQRWKARVRSYSYLAGVGAGNTEAGPWDANYYAQVTRLSGFVKPGPAATAVFLEEHPDSINDPCLYPPYAAQWIDLPASFHERGCNFSFADGHVELHRWASATTVQPVRVGVFSVVPTQRNDPDLSWLRLHAPRK